MRRINWETRQHLMALGLVGSMYLIAQASAVAPDNMAGWLDGAYRILNGFPLQVVWGQAQSNWGTLACIGLAYFMMNGNYFIGFKSRVTLIDRGKKKQPLVLLPFFHPFSPLGHLIDRHFSRHKLGIQSSPWLRFYFVFLGFFSLASGVSFVLAVYYYSSPNFPVDLFSAWGVAFHHWHAIWLSATSGGGELAGIAITYFYWRHGAPLVSELIIRAGGVGFFRGCLAEYTGYVEEAIVEQTGYNDLATAIVAHPIFRNLPINIWHRD